VLGLTVTIDHKGNGGELRIGYKTLDQLDGLCRRLNP
jgi:ParB family chromosome partitioning protein